MTESDSMIKIPLKALQMNMLFSTYCNFKVICQVKTKIVQLDFRFINKKNHITKIKQKGLTKASKVV